MPKRPLRVFLSHTSELDAYPLDGKTFLDAAKDAVTRAGHVIVDMDYFEASARTPEEVCAARVKEADVYVGLFGFRYGSRVPDGKRVSYTQMEFEVARDEGKPLLLLLLDKRSGAVPFDGLGDADDIVAQQELRKMVMSARTTVQSFITPAELTLELKDALDSHDRQAARLPMPLPAEFVRILGESPDAEPVCAGILRRAGTGFMTGAKAYADVAPGDPSSDLSQLLHLVAANIAHDAYRELTARDVTLWVALCAHVCECAWMAPAAVRALLGADDALEREWTRHVAWVRRQGPEHWLGVAGESVRDLPDTEVLLALPEDLGPPERFAVALFLERHLAAVAAKATLEGAELFTLQTREEPFPRIEAVYGFVQATLDTPLRTCADAAMERFGDVRTVHGCRLLYVSAMLRLAFQLRRLVEVTGDGLIGPVRERAVRDESLAAVQVLVADVQPEGLRHEDVLTFRLEPRTPRSLEAARSEMVALQSITDGLSAILAEHYRPDMRTSVLRLRYPRLRSTLDDPNGYVSARGLRFEPEVGRLGIDAPKALPLLVRPLYGNRPEIGIRELMQNALDAVRARASVSDLATQQESGSAPVQVSAGVREASDDRPRPPVHWRQWLEVVDEGIGMTADVIRDAFLIAGGSFDPVRSPDGSEPSPRAMPRIGRFGVGVLATFLVGSETQVITRHASDPDGGLCFAMSLDSADVELYRCEAPIGTTVRVELKEEVAGALTRDSSGWDWYHLTEPRLRRFVHHDAEVQELPKHQTPLDLDEPSLEWTRLEVPGYRMVYWTPSPLQPWLGTIFVNGIRTLVSHRNFDVHLLDPVRQLAQPLVSIFDDHQRCELTLDRNGFVTLPYDVLAAVRTDATWDHLAWLVLQAGEGSEHPIRISSPIWEETRLHLGQGDGVVDGAPFVALAEGIVPLSRQRLLRAGVTKVSFVLIGRPDPASMPRVDALASIAERLGREWAVGLLSVQMFGGFGHHPAAAAIEEADRFVAGALEPIRTVCQAVTEAVGKPYADLRARALRTETGRMLVGDPVSGASFDPLHEFWPEVEEAGGYGILHAELDTNAEEAGEFLSSAAGELDSHWEASGLPALLPFDGDVASDDLRRRAERLSALGW